MTAPRTTRSPPCSASRWQRHGAGHTVAILTTGEQHANPHGTVHGAVFYAVAGAAVAAAANDAENSGIISSVLVEYLQPAALGDELYAEVAREVSTGREDIFTGSVRRGAEGDLLAWVRARGTRRARAGLSLPPDASTRTGPERGGISRWPNLWEPGH